jgi:hypothetical protein
MLAIAVDNQPIGGSSLVGSLETLLIDGRRDGR